MALGGLGDTHVVEELGSMFADELAYGFQLYNDAVAVEVCLIDLLQLLAFVVGMEKLFALEGDGAEGELDGEGFLVDGLVHAVAQVVEDFHGGADYGVHMEVFCAGDHVLGFKEVLRAAARSKRKLISVIRTN